MRLVRLSICPCGFSTLDDSILVGQTYVVYPGTIKMGFSYFCGGCKRTLTNIVAIKADQIIETDLKPEYLPLRLFDTE
jgi:hypothetical protein